jgi:hypothetical protein
VVNESEDFSPEASLFIGNKWEYVPEEDRVEVQQDIFYKLNQVYPGIRKTQIHYMSVKKVRAFTEMFHSSLNKYSLINRGMLFLFGLVFHILLLNYTKMSHCMFLEH